MNTQYQLSSLSTKPIRITRDIYQKDKSGNIKSWTVTEVYRSGAITVDSLQELPYSNDAEFVTDPELCSNLALTDRIRVSYEFDKTFGDLEMVDVENNWNRFGAEWLNNDKNNWQVDYESIVLTGPFQVEQVTKTGTFPITLSSRLKYNWS
jgi:hypothetical protein